MPIVSIILPTYKEPRGLVRSIQSVMHQSFTDWELIVVDDGLTESARVQLLEYSTRDPRIFVLKNPHNMGIQKSLNSGLKNSKGTYIARIDDDDEWIDTEKLAKQVRFLDTHTDHVLVGTGIVVVDQDRKELTKYILPETDFEIRQRMLIKNCFVHSSVLFNKEKACDLGGYSEDTHVLHIEDYDLWLRLGRIGKMHNIPDYSVMFTLHSGSVSAQNRKAQFCRTLRMIKRFKGSYPYYFVGYIKTTMAVYSWSFFRILPPWMKNFILKIYKEI